MHEHVRLAEIRDELLNDICAAIPWRLEYGRDSPGVACGGYGAVFPLFYVGEFAVALMQKRVDLSDARLEAATCAEKREEAMAEVLPSRLSRVQQLHWVIGRLDYIGTGLGIYQARVFARLLRTQWQLMCEEYVDLQVLNSGENRLKIAETIAQIRISQTRYASAPKPTVDPDTISTITAALRLAKYSGDKYKKMSYTEILSVGNNALERSEMTATDVD
ncbi:MAG: hypothetical protein Q9159_005758 [Coniocarpon cinnabarinum]